MNAKKFSIGDCIYDGMEAGYHDLKFELQPNTTVETYTISDLIDFDDLMDALGDDLAKDIAESVHGTLSIFDGNVSYKNSRDRLELYFVINHNIDIVHILSSGEFQPGRYMCNYEGIFNLQNSNVDNL